MVEVADRLWRLGDPFGIINFYLADRILIDAGTIWHRPFLQWLKGRPIEAVALTHWHPDHQGLADALCRSRRVPLWVPEADADAACGQAPMQPDNRLMRLLRPILAGPTRRVDRRLRDGDSVGEFRAIHAPGHTPGHTIYFRERDRVAIIGDILANLHFITLQPGLRLPPWFFNFDGRTNRLAVRRVVDLEPAIICFGHGLPLRNVNALKDFVQQRGL